MASKTLLLFVEDDAQESFLRPLAKRLAQDAGVPIDIITRHASGGVGATLRSLKEFVRRHGNGHEALPDGLLVAVDANCHGYSGRQKEVLESVGGLAQFVISAIPDPHIERWLLLDAEAFRTVLGRGCQAPDAKCEKDRYKMLLAQAVADAGVSPLLGGVEYAEDLAKAINPQAAADRDDSFAKFLGAYRAWLNRMKQP